MTTLCQNINNIDYNNNTNMVESELVWLIRPTAATALQKKSQTCSTNKQTISFTKSIFST